MIPKTIHYCWFGHNPLPTSALRCIASWRKHFPDYEIKEWNESNFDVDCIPYVKRAYEHKKYAFVSDYARFAILYQHGGIYFDTDVEVIRDMEDVLSKGSYMGMENLKVNPGEGMATEAYAPLLKEIMDYYATLQFADAEGNLLHEGTVVKHTTTVLERQGYKQNGELQQIGGFLIYPNDWFNPLEDTTGRLNITANTHSIHWYTKTWCENYGPLRKWVMRYLHRVFGTDCFAKLRNLLHL